MTNLKITISLELKKEMEKFPKINWSEVTRKAIKKKIRELKFLMRFTTDSEITSEESLKTGKGVKELLAKHYKGIEE